MALLAELNDFRQLYGRNIIRGAITGIDNSMVYLGWKKHSRGPLNIGFDVTFRCNANCSFCDVVPFGIEKMKLEKKELTTEECLDIIKQAGEAGTWTMSFTGGEP